MWTTEYHPVKNTGTNSVKSKEPDPAKSTGSDSAAGMRNNSAGKGKRLLHNLFFVLGMVLCLLMIHCRAVSAAENFELHLLDAGQGQGVLIRSGEHAMLIDGGGRESSSFVISYLRQQGIERFDYIVVSHYDEDHMSGIIGALSAFGNDILLLPGYAGEGKLYESLAVTAVSNGCAIVHGGAGQSFPLGDAVIDIVGPVSNAYENDNDRSLAVKVTYGNTSCLICGDAEQQGELDMAAAGTYLRADIYIADHHGSSTSSMDAFLDAVSPAYAMISCGDGNSYGHPGVETMQRLQNRGIGMFRTDKQGTIIAYSDGENIWFSTDPCADWSSGNVTGEDGSRALPGEADQTEPGTDVAEDPSANASNEGEYRYVCNTNTRKFHNLDCRSVTQMKEEHRLFTNLTRDELLAEGYEPCGNCKP